MNDVIDVDALKSKIDKFAKDREWEQFHNPKNLAMALSVEAGELVEIFQWLTLEQSEAVNCDKIKKERVAEEVADIITYAVRLCSVLDINLAKSISQKIIKNSKKYPIEKSKGSSKKYSEL